MSIRFLTANLIKIYVYCGILRRNFYSNAIIVFMLMRII